MTPLIKTFSLLCITILLFSCEKKELPVQGCMNEFAMNYDSAAELTCCCEYDTSAVINSLIGTYEFIDYCDHFNYDYHTSISRDLEVNDQVIIENFSIYKRTFKGRFEEGEFAIKDSYYVGGCLFDFEGSLMKEEGKIMIVSTNKVIEGLCNNVSDLSCTAIAD